ncbi:MAG: hydrogenase maturation nickel metallochaperone HypA [Bacteroidetes bacterium]|nr:hydrogenase maturation nickel metallochaperone HypA [Bacteroidota bacterium]
MSDENVRTMHELSIAEHIVEIAVTHLQRDGASRVREIELEIGTLSGIEIDALTFALDVVTKDTALRDATVHIQRVEGRSRCNSCGEEFAMEDFFSPCPSCGTFDSTVLQGEEMRVKSLLVHE